MQEGSKHVVRGAPVGRLPALQASSLKHIQRGLLTTTTAAQKAAVGRVLVRLHSTACAPVTPAAGLERLRALQAAPFNPSPDHILPHTA